jgi:APA family basic amino acid/polyamine antiporter
LFVIYLGEFWPAATLPVNRFVILTLLVGILAAINLRGVHIGAHVSTAFTVAKLASLGIVCVAGVFYLISTHRIVPPASAPASANAWLQAIVLLIFAYGGFETALISTGEARDPRRDGPFALFVALVTCTVIYGNILGTPRITFALAEGGDFPSVFALVHKRFRTPYFSILVFSLLVWGLALVGSFTWNVTLSAGSRLFYYGVVCAALPALRRKSTRPAIFQVRGGTCLAALGVLICVGLLTRIDYSKSLVILAAVAVALLNWLAVRKRADSVAS